ncbi:PREDICTED: synaptic vesicle glycoprotein 2B-like [Atta cephalotes]|uniref:Major facilitator superfamily (MFS) profile domain-containing protein n=1 Tax=Atta cephalotes TaxID=12957 RepID=A0A158N980_ATTCE|nr:PREDICTED: synaptic vesicle glycoprotein 2B-like [Atta cephalotes]
MVEGEPDTKRNIKCDVKDERLNGCGSKELELACIGLKGKTLDPEKGSYVQADFEKAIELSEYGKFHYFLLAVCGFVSTSEEMDVISMSFILPSAQCDLKLDTQAKGWLNSIIFIGMMAGAYAWGSIADALGRRKVLIAISFMNALCIVASSFSQTYELFMLFRFLNGAALGGSGPVIWSYFAEFQPKSKRGSMLSFMAAFWTLGNLFVAGKIKVKELILDDYPDSNPVKDEVEEKSKCKTMLGDIVENSRLLFVTPILRFTIISIVINFTFHIGYYGLMMWFPELFNRFDEFHRDQPGKVASICQVTDYVVNKGSHSVENVCSDKIGASVFMESLITVASAIPANIIAVLGMDRLGRKFFLVFSTFSSGLCSIGLYFVYNKYQNLTVSAIFSGAISCGNAALDCLITEVFPTQLRATGIAISMVAARLGGIIGNIVIAQLLDMYCPAPTFIVAALLIGGGLLCLFLPNTTREPLS